MTRHEGGPRGDRRRLISEPTDRHKHVFLSLPEPRCESSDYMGHVYESKTNERQQLRSELRCSFFPLLPLRTLFHHTTYVWPHFSLSVGSGEISFFVVTVSLSTFLSFCVLHEVIRGKHSFFTAIRKRCAWLK